MGIMKRINNRPLTNGTSSYSWIVMKLRNCHDALFSSHEEANIFFIQNQLLPWEAFQKKFPGISINKLFMTLKPAQINWLLKRAYKRTPSYQAPDFFSYYSIGCPKELNSSALIARLRNNKNVELAYLETDMSDSPSVSTYGALNYSQEYLNAPPQGINAKYAWKQKGGKGVANVRFIDIERGWLPHHESFIVKTLSCTGFNDYHYRDHGAAIFGIISMQKNNEGIMGISPNARGTIVSQWRPNGSFNTADAIMAATARLRFGDIILLEAQTCLDYNNGITWPVEIHEANSQAIRLATACGIIVIEAAGNGDLNSLQGNDLDLLNIRGKRILNPLHHGFCDSGALIVSAASSSVPHERICYSNYGSRINCFAWGEKVVTAGNYPRSSGSAINTYTNNFGGTSSASAIITGAAIAVQSIAEAKFNYRLGPSQMREILSNEKYGTTSKNGHFSDKIGTMPDLKKIIDRVLDNPIHLMGKQTTSKGKS